MTWLVVLYMVVGFFAIAFVLVSLYRYYWQKPTTPPRYPPDSYMRQVGLTCPDYWVYDATRDVCVNQFNIPVNDPKKCYDKNNEKKFNKITRWPVNSNEIDHVLQGRCDWVRQCGPSKKLPASWVGVEEHC